jgi:hypothetical protein
MRAQARALCPIATGAFTENVFLGRRAADKSGRSFVFARAEEKSPNPVDKHVGGRVRMRRMMLAMSQGKLGDALGGEMAWREAFSRHTANHSILTPRVWCDQRVN